MSGRTACEVPTGLFAACHAISHASTRELVWTTTERELSHLTTATVCLLVTSENQALVVSGASQAMPASLPLALKLARDIGDRLLVLEGGKVCAAPCLVNDRLAGAIVLVSNTDQPIAEQDRIVLAAVAVCTTQALAALDLRASLARSLHDGPVQDLATALMMLEHLFQSGEIAGGASTSLAVQTLKTAAVELRRFIAALQGGDVDAATIDSPLLASTLFPDAAQEEALLEVTREALRNIRKHAEAQSIQIALQRTMSEIAVMIQDDGAGFTGEAKPGHFGLAQMRENAERAGAAMHVASTRCHGTRVLLRAQEPGASDTHAGVGVKDSADE